MGADGFEKLCTDARIALDGPLALLLAWQFQTGEMMKITNEEWTRGTSTFKCVASMVDTQSAHTRQDRFDFCAFCPGVGARGTPDAGQEKCETGREESTL